VQALLVAAVGADADGAVVQTEQVERAAAQPRAVEGGRERADDAPQLDEALLDEVAQHDERHLVVEVLAGIRYEHQRHRARRLLRYLEARHGGG
jgi:hypothetical protein